VIALGRTKRVHFVGVGGIGMSGIAELLANLGYAVSGSDARRSDITDRLAMLGVRVDIGHDRSHVGEADVVVVSSAIDTRNPEVAEARARRIPVIPRAEMLAELMRLRVGIAVAGAHGKTTTTSMVALVLERAGLDPTAVIGGRLSAFGSNARLGRGPYMVAEADESDRSFLKLTPTVAVVTNIDHEHMEAYGSFDRLTAAFRDFADRVPFYGAVIACIDDEPVRDLVPTLMRRVITYGFAPDADVCGVDPETDGRGGRCQVRFRARHDAPSISVGTIALAVPGVHNLLNALAAVAVGLELEVPFDRVASALAEFQGAERRYQLRGEVAGVTVVDDYGHHPTELAAVLRAARAGDPKRLVAVFQPHRYTRTRDLMDRFGPALGLADVVVLTDIYAAGEPPIAEASLDALAAAIRPFVKELRLVRALDEVPAAVAGLAREGDLVLLLGAGSIGHIGGQVLAAVGAGKAEA
jgi:UDP-N-acetylmuramate--alanine ligase